MSIIGSVGGTNSELMQMLQRLAGQSDESSQGTAVRGSPPQGAPPPGGPPDGGAMLSEEVASFAEEAGLDAETIAALQEDLEAAIASAMENAEESQSTDPREIIDGAVTSTLAEYGLDGEAFISEFKESMPPEGAPPPGAMDAASSQEDLITQILDLVSEGTASSGAYGNLSLLDTLA